MATKTANKDAAKNAEASTEEKAPETTSEASTEPEVEGLGRNLGLEKAKRLFGADNAVKAMDAVAAAGGYGTFSEKQYNDPLFGGFAIPDPETLSENDTERREKYAAIRAKIEKALQPFKK
jgi:hypothetical protein